MNTINIIIISIVIHHVFVVVGVFVQKFFHEFARMFAVFDCCFCCRRWWWWWYVGDGCRNRVFVHSHWLCIFRCLNATCNTHTHTTMKYCLELFARCSCPEVSLSRRRILTIFQSCVAMQAIENAKEKVILVNMFRLNLFVSSSLIVVFVKLRKLHFHLAFRCHLMTANLIMYLPNWVNRFQLVEQAVGEVCSEINLLKINARQVWSALQ